MKILLIFTLLNIIKDFKAKGSTANSSPSGSKTTADPTLNLLNGITATTSEVQAITSLTVAFPVCCYTESCADWDVTINRSSTTVTTTTTSPTTSPTTKTTTRTTTKTTTKTTTSPTKTATTVTTTSPTSSPTTSSTTKTTTPTTSPTTKTTTTTTVTTTTPTTTETSTTTSTKPLTSTSTKGITSTTTTSDKIKSSSTESTTTSAKSKITTKSAGKKVTSPITEEPNTTTTELDLINSLNESTSESTTNYSFDSSSFETTLVLNDTTTEITDWENSTESSTTTEISSTNETTTIVEMSSEQKSETTMEMNENTTTLEASESTQDLNDTISTIDSSSTLTTSEDATTNTTEITTTESNVTEYVETSSSQLTSSTSKTLSSSPATKPITAKSSHSSSTTTSTSTKPTTTSSNPISTKKTSPSSTPSTTSTSTSRPSSSSTISKVSSTKSSTTTAAPSTSSSTSLKSSTPVKSTVVTTEEDDMNSTTTNVETTSSGTEFIEQNTTTPDITSTTSSAQTSTEVKTSSTSTITTTTTTATTKKISTSPTSVVSSTKAPSTSSPNLSTTGTPTKTSGSTTTSQPPTTSTIDAKCLVQCPDGYLTGTSVCFLIIPASSVQSYQSALSQCRNTAKQDMILFENMRNRADLYLLSQYSVSNEAGWFFANGGGSMTERFDKEAAVFNIFQQTIATTQISEMVGISDSTNNVSAICVLPQYCNSPVCNVEIGLEILGVDYKLTPNDATISSGEKTDITCSYTHQTTSVSCGTRGVLIPSLSMITCEPASELQLVSNDTGAAVGSCADCFGRGTASCVQLNSTDYQCVCKNGYSMKTCWYTENQCQDDSCGNGTCIDNIDSITCDCDWGYEGDTCQINRDMSVTHPNSSFFERIGQTFDLSTVISMQISFLTVATEVFRVLGKVLTSNDDDDPQETHQSLRGVLFTMGTTAVLLFSDPYKFMLPSATCRMYFLIIHFLFIYTMNQWMWEGFNANQVLRCRHINQWEIGFDGKKSFGIMSVPRLVIPAIIIAVIIVVIYHTGWYQLISTWTCIGVICESTSSMWLPIIFTIFGLLLLSTAIFECSILVKHRRPLFDMIIKDRIVKKEGILHGQNIEKCQRNVTYCFFGIWMLAVLWLLIIVAADKKSNVLIGLIAMAWALLYGIFCVVQGIVTCPGTYKSALIYLMKKLPERLSPSYEPMSMFTRPEVLEIAKLSKAEQEKMFDQHIPKNAQRLLMFKWDYQLGKKMKEGKTLNDSVKEILRDQVHKMDESAATDYQRKQVFDTFSNWVQLDTVLNPNPDMIAMMPNFEKVRIGAVIKGDLAENSEFFVVPNFGVFEPSIPESLKETKGDDYENEEKRRRIVDAIKTSQPPTTSTIDAKCLVQCPDGYLTGTSVCFLIIPASSVQSYQSALSQCRNTAKQDMILFENMRNRADLYLLSQYSVSNEAGWFFANGGGSMTERFDKEAAVFNIFQQTIATTQISEMVGISDSTNNVSAICVLPQYCNSPVCNVEIGLEILGVDYKLTPNDATISSGEKTDITCSYTHQTTSVSCGTRGVLIPSLSMITCEPASELQLVSNDTGAAVGSCADCFGRGTASCVQLNSTDYQCVCKNGYSMKTCWYTENQCQDDSCGNGTCIDNIDSITCDCDWGYEGDTCQINRDMSVTHPNSSFFERIGQTFDLSTVISMQISFLTVATEVFRVLGKVLTSNDDDDPQETHQSLRGVLFTMGTTAVLLFSDPYKFMLPSATCRMYFLIIHFLFIYTMNQWMWEGFNANQVLRCRHINQWEIGFDGKKSFGIMSVPRLVIPAIIIAVIIVVIYHTGWYQLISTWTCIGVICESTSSMWLPIIFTIFGLLLLSTAIFECSILVKHRRPLFDMIIKDRIVKKEGILHGQNIEKCQRNVTYCFFGIWMLAVLWLLIIVAADKKSNVLIGLIAMAWALLYGIFCVVQGIVTCPGTYKSALIYLMKKLPERLSPSYEPMSMFTRPEVLEIAKLSKAEQEKMFDQHIPKNAQRLLMFKWDYQLGKKMKEGKTLNDSVKEILRDQVHKMDESAATDYQRKQVFDTFSNWVQLDTVLNPNPDMIAMMPNFEKVRIGAVIKGDLAENSEFFVVPNFGVFEPSIPESLKETKGDDYENEEKRRRIVDAIKNNYHILREEVEAQSNFIHSSIHFKYVS